MRTRRIDANNDWTFGAGRQSYATQSEAVRQKVKTRLQMFLGDWFLDEDIGIDWITEMSSRNQTTRIVSDAKYCILQTMGVSTLDKFGYTRDSKTRKLSITATYTDIYGQTNEVTT
ncbi:hypothetical protein [Lelliottia wanjuensis]|uniref:hypothetical protein n=1 Tax=Lelliottia wanjuensis TaxID=3050585 RepID=UPI00254DC53E|nr:hypothetical protein [Lelliottia sp. V104_15]MDK9607119.1 hypothetical protein [Lelliottia sp. V104_15]